MYKDLIFSKKMKEKPKKY